MLSHLSKFAAGLMLLMAVVSYSAVPTTPNGMYDQATINPFTIGSCSGEGAGCSGVYGMDWLSDGRMVLLTSDFQAHGNMPGAGRVKSKVTLLSGLTGGGTVTAQDIATNFKLPTGVVVANDKIYVVDMDSFYVIPNNNPATDAASLAANRQRRFQMPNPLMDNGNNAPANFRFPAAQGDNSPPISGGWTNLNSYFHSYVFTPVYYQGKFYANNSGATLSGNGTANLGPSSFFSGALMAWDTATTQLDTNVNRAGGGLRSPNGNCLGPGGVIFSADNQGSYLPMCTITRFKPFTNQFAGYRQDPGYFPNFAQAAYDRGLMNYDPPVAINTWDQTGHTGWVSTTQPYYLTSGPYAGDLIVGDMNSRGMWRVAFDTLNDTTNTENIQGAVFYFTPGNSGGTLGTGNNGMNRFTQGPDGSIYAGALRGVGNWGMGPATNLIYKFTPKASPTQFEIRRIRSLQDGYELILNRKVNPATVVVGNFTVNQRSWVRQSAYGLGAPGGEGAPIYTNRPISSVAISNDSMRIHLVVPGVLRINQGRRGDTVTHWHTQFTFSPNLLSTSGAATYTTEAAYAQNWISSRTWDPAIATSITPPSQKISMLQDHVWFTAAHGVLQVNLDGMQIYRVVLHDLKGRILSSQTGSGASRLEFKAPLRTQSLYLLEVRSGSDVYKKVVIF